MSQALAVARRELRASFKSPIAYVTIALFVINVGGVCVTYGIPDPVWK